MTKIGRPKTRVATKQQSCGRSGREPERETIRANTGAVKSERGEAAGLNTQGRQSVNVLGTTEGKENK